MIFPLRCPDPKCDQEIPSHWKFCALCGKVPERKPRVNCACGEERFTPQSRFCFACGTALPEVS